MGQKRLLTRVLVGLGLAIAVVALASWVLFPDWRGTPQGIASLLVAATAVVYFAKAVVDILVGAGKLAGGEKGEAAGSVVASGARSVAVGDDAQRPVTITGDIGRGARVRIGDEIHHAEPVAKAVHQLVRSTEDFTGREEELRDIGEWEVSGGESVTVAESVVCDLTEEARELIVAASRGRHGIVMMVQDHDGAAASINGKNFVDKGSLRSAAAWQHAVEQLVSHNLLRKRDRNGEQLSITHEGYRVADLVAARSGELGGEEGRMRGGRGRGLEIASAKWGAGDSVADVTEHLQALVSDDRLKMLVNYKTMGCDPVEHVEKTLTVEYWFDGVRKRKVTRENDMLSLP